MKSLKFKFRTFFNFKNGFAVINLSFFFGFELNISKLFVCFIRLFRFDILLKRLNLNKFFLNVFSLLIFLIFVVFLIVIVFLLIE